MAEENKKIFPWGLHPLDNWIKDELDRRTREYGSDPAGKPYSGPKTAWTRVFSNGISSMADEGLQGFVMGGTEGFDESYGFGTDNYITIGVDAYGKPHEIGSMTGEAIVGDKTKLFSDFPHRPPPSIVSIDTEFSGGANSGFNALCRKTKITWKCYSLSQLEYLTPYFLTPRITCLVEWGWNHYDTISLVDLTDTKWLYGIFEGTREYTSEWIEASNGNYDLAMGFITDYGYSINEYGGYTCFTTITNANYLVEGQSYQNKQTSQTDAKDKKKTIQLKDFTEFTFNDMENMTIQNKPDKKTDVAKKLNIKIEGRVFKYEKDAWMKMDLVADIINTFFSIKFIDKDENDTNVGASRFDVKDVTICAHPALKSTNKNILIPNQFAPRFVTKDPKATQGKSLADASTQSGNYYTLFPDIKNVIDKFEFEESYDDIKSVINKDGTSFPVYSIYPSTDGTGPTSGYWGYLQDIYISVDFFKSLVKKNETILKLVEELLQHISEAVCNICQLQCRPVERNGTVYTVIDSNFSPINTVKDAKSLLTISIGSVNSAFMKSAEFSVKLSGEMSNQMVMQSASGKDLPGEYGTANYDAKTMEISKFSRGDRLFDRGVIPPDKTTPSNNTKDNSQTKLKRMFKSENKKEFYVYTAPDKKTVHILAENGPSFLKSVLLNTKDKRSVYTNNGLMPGTNFTMELLGIGGITALSQFTLDHVPSSYNYERCVWQVSDVKQKVENKIWTTSVTAQARPLTSIE
jgi:hypothetical protein